jgi:hypothetical protein
MFCRFPVPSRKIAFLVGKTQDLQEVEDAINRILSLFTIQFAFLVKS